jgi:glycyl-tRNA synthetase beta chain
MSTNTLLFEIGCEELPSSSLRDLGEGLLDSVLQQLAEHKLAYGTARWFASPRRLAVLVEELVEQAADETVEALGPPVAAARDADGNWTRAATGFAARLGVDAGALEVIDTPKGPRLGLRQHVPGIKTRDALAAMMDEASARLPIAKRMRWGASRREFARPVHWIVLMLDGEHGFGEVMGLASGNVTRGHRFHAPGAFALDTAADYEARLHDARVMVDFAARSAEIRRQVVAAAEALHATALIDEDLLEEVTSLVEWPVALSGSFDESFLDVPAEALISSMQSHQKYFPVQDHSGKLLAHFITVSNIQSRDPAQVIAGNERVIRPRLADAAFFFEKDKSETLESRLPRLGSVIFQKDLGSVLDKTRRVQRLSAALAEAIGADPAQAGRAAELCKTDLVSELVLEFGDLQGIAGSYYALNDGEDPVVAQAIAEHYWPKQAGSELPGNAVGMAVALADRLDTLLGIFAIGQPPSGSKDPFALRRASIGVLRILIEGDLALDLPTCLTLAEAGFEPGRVGADVQQQVIDYIFDRMPALYEDGTIPIEMIRAVRAVGCTVPADFDRRVKAVHLFSQRSEAAALAAANKRVGNILSKAEDLGSEMEVSDNLLLEPQEKALFSALMAIEGENRQSLDKQDYATALSRLAGLREPVDAFFEDVMVNAEDPALRQNRLALLAQLRAQFLAIADISQLAA